jgi:hypothetical protein
MTSGIGKTKSEAIDNYQFHKGPKKKKKKNWIFPSNYTHPNFKAFILEDSE